MEKCQSNKKNYLTITDDKTKQELLVKQINKISADLLLETKTSDVLLFLNPSYCDKIAYIIAEILNDTYTKNTLSFIHSYINNQKEIQKTFIDLTNKSISIDSNSNSFLTKKKICTQIALFYVKFCHLYSAIVKVINPKKKKGKKIHMGFCQQRNLHKI